MEDKVKNYKKHETCYNYKQTINEIKNAFSTNKNIKITFMRNEEQLDLTIKIKYKKKSEYNPYRLDIVFYIEIDKNYPNSQPYVKTLTNVNIKFKYVSLLILRSSIIEICLTAL